MCVCVFVNVYVCNAYAYFFLNANSGGQTNIPKAMLRYSEISAFLQMLVQISQKKPA